MADDRSWSTADHVPTAAALPTLPRETLWTVTKQARTASAIIRRLSHGTELVYFVGDDVQASQLYRIGDAQLYEDADAKLREFLDRGWR